MNRFLADENLPLPVVAELRSLGYDVVTLHEAGRGNQKFPDEKVLHLAAEQNRAEIWAPPPCYFGRIYRKLITFFLYPVNPVRVLRSEICAWPCFQRTSYRCW